MEQGKVAEGLEAEREALMAYLESLPEAAWDKPSLCEGWRVRDVIAHLVGNAKDVAAQNLEGAGSPEYNQRQVDERASASPADLLAEWKEQGPLLEQGVLALPKEMWTSPFPPFGTVGTAVTRLLEDIWIHAQDVRLPLGDEASTLGPGIEAVVDSAAFELGERIPRLAPDVGRVEIDVAGHKRTIETAGTETVTISGDPVAFGLVATGRMSLEEASADGKLAVSPALGDGFAGALNMYGS